MERIFIFLLEVFRNKPDEMPNNCVAVTSIPLLLLKNRGNANHEGLTQIQKAREIKGLSIAEVCRRTGLSYDNYIKYEREEVKIQYMNLETLDKISDVLGVNLLTDYHTFKKNSVQVVKQYMEENKLSIRKFAEICNVSATSVKQWRNGKCSPSYEIWEKYFKRI